MVLANVLLEFFKNSYIYKLFANECNITTYGLNDLTDFEEMFRKCSEEKIRLQS